MIDFGFATKHERGVITAALRHYEQTQGAKSRKQADARDRAMSGANARVANALLRQLDCR